MNIKSKNIIISTSVCICSCIILLGTYWTINKEDISLIIKGKETKVSTFKTTVKDLLDENNIVYNDNFEISPGLNTKVKDYMDINIVEIKKEEQVEYEDINFDVQLIEDKELDKGTTEITQDGESGQREKVYELTYRDGKLVGKYLVKSEINKESKDKIVKKGIKEEVIVASREETTRSKSNEESSNTTVNTQDTSSQNTSSSSNGKMNVTATAYAGDTITSTGTVPKWGTIAVDPKVIPYGTKVYIPKFGQTFTAEDCGGAIKGNKIDIFMGSEGEAYNWGRQDIEIIIE